MKKRYTILTVFLLTIAMAQSPIIYYYTSGISALMILVPYFALVLGLTAWLLLAVVINNKRQKTTFQKAGLIFIIFIGSWATFKGEEIVESLNWHLRINSRKTIVDLVKTNQLNPNASQKKNICQLNKWSIPPISNGGNEITIHRGKNKTVTVEFYINRGFLDHYSAFAYTDNPIKISEFDNRSNFKKGMHLNKKLEENWYRLSF